MTLEDFKKRANQVLMIGKMIAEMTHATWDDEAVDGLNYLLNDTETLNKAVTFINNRRVLSQPADK